MLLIVLSFFASAESEICGDTTIRRFRPVGTVESSGSNIIVPADGVLAAELGWSGVSECSATGAPGTVELVSELDPSETTTLVIPPRGTAPFGWVPHGLEPGQYTATWWPAGGEEETGRLIVTDETAEGPPGVPTVESVDVTRYELWEGSWTSISASIDFPTGSDLLFEVELAGDDGAVIEAGRSFSGHTGSVETSLLPDEVCVRARFVSWSGQPGEWSDMECATPDTTSDVNLARSCGCASEPFRAPAAVGVAILLLGVARRRRRVV